MSIYPDTITAIGAIVGACISVCISNKVRTNVRLSSIGSALGSIGGASVGGLSRFSCLDRSTRDPSSTANHYTSEKLIS